MERANGRLRQQRLTVDDRLLGHISPFAWEHINLAGN
jgi:hypothetical protein